MQLVKFNLKSTRFTHLELSLLDLAKAEIKKGASLEALEKALTVELEKWKEKIAKYRNTPTKITIAGGQVTISHHGKVLIIFETIF